MSLYKKRKGNPPKAIKFCSCCRRNLAADTGKRLRSQETGLVREFHKSCATKSLQLNNKWELP